MRFEIQSPLRGEGLRVEVLVGLPCRVVLYGGDCGDWVEIRTLTVTDWEGWWNGFKDGVEAVDHNATFTEGWSD